MDERAAQETGPRAGLRQIFVDVTPLRTSRDFRLLLSGRFISAAGRQITLVAIFYQVYQLTQSAAAVGLVGLIQLVPLLFTSIAGGPVVDRVDRRKLLIATQFGQALASGLLLAGALAGRPPLALVYAAAALAAAIGGVEGPTGSAITPNVVGRRQLPAALALNAMAWTTAQIVGPAVAGVVIGSVGLAWAYGLDVASYAGSIAAVLLMSPLPPVHAGGTPPAGLEAVREAFAYLRGRPVLQWAFGIDLVAMIFGMPRALFPVLAATQFQRGPEVVGALFAALAIGALAGVLTAGWVGRVKRQGAAVMAAVFVWGAGITAFGLVGRRLWLGLLLLAIAGGADVISAVFRGTILQTNIPDSLRGRMSAVHILVVTGGPRLGDFEAGVVAQAFTPQASVVSGGLACLLGVALIALFVPKFARHRAASD